MSPLRMFTRIDGLKEAVPLAEYESVVEEIASVSFLYTMISIQNGGFGKNSKDRDKASKKILGRFLVCQIDARLKKIAG